MAICLNHMMKGTVGDIMTHEEAIPILEQRRNLPRKFQCINEAEYVGISDKKLNCPAFFADKYKKETDAFDLAIRALKNRTIGVPVTAEQLKRKIGDPLWVESARRAEWMILWGYNPPEVYGRSFIFTRRTAQKEMFPFSGLGITWRAYSYPPAYIDRSELTAYWKEYTGADAGFHYCSKCKQQAVNYDDSVDVVEVLSDFCPFCGRAMTPEAWAELENRLMR